MNSVTTRSNGPGTDCPTKSLPSFVSSSLAPHLCEEGQPINAGAQPPHCFGCPSPTRVGAAEDEAMGGDDLLGLRDCPRLPDSLLLGTYIFYRESDVLLGSSSPYLYFSRVMFGSRISIEFQIVCVMFCHGLIFDFEKRPSEVYNW